uniref:Uncharacterized protein n=1 Tax=Tolypothrix bouteillei VB521301 TaxID=1479485 RepID=A0A0C1RAB6_9CYAN
MLQYFSYFCFLFLGILLLLIFYIAYLYLKTVSKLNKALHESQLPEELVNFPIYISTIEEYLFVKSLVDAGVSQIYQLPSEWNSGRQALQRGEPPQRAASAIQTKSTYVDFVHSPRRR